MVNTLTGATVAGAGLFEHPERNCAGLDEYVTAAVANDDSCCKCCCPKGGHQCAKPVGHEGQHHCASNHSW